MWLETRAIDSHRANSRLLKKALRLTDKDDVSTVIHVNAATITDNYWICPVGSDLVYNDVKFTDDYFSNLALRGGYVILVQQVDRVSRDGLLLAERVSELADKGIKLYSVDLR